MDTIKYSIIIPAFNAAPYLSRCLDSILGQPYPDFEVIVVNDGSTDETLQILYDYARYHSNLVVLSQRNAGPGAARELGIKHASGDYIMFSDADDYWELDFLRGIDTYIKKRSPDILEFGYRKVSTKGEVISNGHVTHVELFGDRCLDHYIDQRNTTNYLWNKAFSARIFTDVVFPHLYTGEDAAVLIQLFSQARSYVSVPDIYYNYVMSAWSLTRAPFSIRKLDKLKSDDFMYNYLSKKRPDLCEKLAYAICARSAVLYCELMLSNTAQKKQLGEQVIQMYWKYRLFIDNKKKASETYSIQRIVLVSLFGLSPRLSVFLYAFAKGLR